MLWKGWGMLIFLTQPPPPFSHVGSYCLFRHKNGTELHWEKGWDQLHRRSDKHFFPGQTL